MHYVAYCDQVGIAALLFEAGAEVNIKNKEGYLPCPRWRTLGRPIQSTAAPTTTSPHDRVTYYESQGQSMLIRRRRTPLHRAAQAGHTTIMKLLVAHGANVNSRDNWGCAADLAHAHICAGA